MKLCECGCGTEVANRFVSGHNTRTLTAEEQGRRGKFSLGNGRGPDKPPKKVHYEGTAAEYHARRAANRKSTSYVKVDGRHHHRTVAEEKLGRPLGPGEIVHHIDHDKHNNHPDNLELMTLPEHTRLHTAHYWGEKRKHVKLI